MEDLEDVVEDGAAVIVEDLEVADSVGTVVGSVVTVEAEVDEVRFYIVSLPHVC